MKSRIPYSIVAVFSLMVASVSLFGCGPLQLHAKGPRATAQVTALGVGELAIDLSKAERTIFESQVTGYDQATHAHVRSAITKLLYASRAYERAAADWPAGSLAPASAIAASQGLLRALDDLTHALPTLPAVRDPLLQAIARIRQAVPPMTVTGAELPPGGIVGVFAVFNLFVTLIAQGKTSWDRLRGFAQQEGATPEQLAAMDVALTGEIAQSERDQQPT